ncbi:Uncharacterized protein DAT39_006672 [Clarias magur]|uniref:Uncharacterized protein n=1 Tax=Clarias magur TaxID=1594786 RepID=A0A8J4XF33_CLAMG|nr:Uncharacterized protein DAT39_006672 [Clarias magur]
MFDEAPLLISQRKGKGGARRRAVKILFTHSLTTPDFNHSSILPRYHPAYRYLSRIESISLAQSLKCTTADITDLYINSVCPQKALEQRCAVETPVSNELSQNERNVYSTIHRFYQDDQIGESRLLE